MACGWNRPLYLAFGLFKGHFRRTLLPAPDDRSPQALANSILEHLRFKRPSEAEAWSYNLLQRLTYLFVIFVLFPLIIWTGLAMSPAIDSVFPWVVTLLGGQQSARTIHFFVTLLLVLFLLVHLFRLFLLDSEIGCAPWSPVASLNLWSEHE